MALSAQIKREEAKATANGQQLAIRLNITSDIPGRYYLPLMLRFPQVQFYDYTKLLGNKSLAPNHHLTYSSNGASQTINGKPLYNANQTWTKERALLDSGFNVAMAFIGKTDLPKFLFDEETGRTYTVISGDKYDARFLDPKAANGIGMIVALGNKDDAMVRQNKRKAKMELRHAAPLPVVMEAIAATTAANPQTVSSQKTAVNQVAGMVRLVEKAHTWVAGSRNLDIGGGPYEATTNALRTKGVTNVVYDKYNRSAAHNDAVVAQFDAGTLTQPVRDRSVDEIHAFATANQIAWDDDPAFMAFTESVTGKQKIDALTQPERNRLYAALESRVEPKAPATRGFDTATLSNVLNVIQEQRFQLEALRVAQAGLKAGGSLYVTVYEGDRTGQGRATTRGFQHNTRLAAYLDTVKMVFPNAVVRGSMIMATKGAATASADIRFKRRDAAPDVNSPKTATDTGTIDPSMERSRLQNLAVSVRPPFLTTLTLQQLADVYGGFTATYNSAVQTMMASFSYLTKTADVTQRNWMALPTEDADAMARVMEQARQEGFDPDRLTANAREVVSTNKQITLKTRAVRPVQPKNDVQLALVQQFAALSDPAKAVYREVRDFYTVLADQRLQAITQRIQRMGGTEVNKKAILDKIREEYELTVQGVYFPYTRFGDHLVIAKKMIEGKEDRVVSAFEAPAEAASFAVMMKAQGYTVKRTVASQYSRDQAGAASTILEEVYTLIDTLTDEGHDVGTRSARETLKDSINQIALNALPDLSYAKHFIHAKKVKGFSTDALRSFSHSVLHGAHHISRINHADALTGALRDFDRQIALTESNDTSQARQVYNELVRRHDYQMNPNTSPVAALLGQLGV
ncbi:MAG: PLxRFG domain-containing protein, partial [Nitrosarchaeum sp.]|nr:PLxRFG domain-containing protein [Nitrosarchaeum sp.]